MTRHLTEDIRREQILDAARQSFIETGFVPTRMEDIARRAGLSKGGVYFHFASKQELFDALVQQEYDLAIGMMDEVRQKDGPVADKLADLAGFYLGRVGSSQVSARFFVVMMAVAIRDPAVNVRLQNMNKAFVTATEEVLRMGVAQGELVEMDTLAIATLLKAIINGLEVAVAMGYTTQLGAVAQASLTTVLNGLRPR